MSEGMKLTIEEWSIEYGIDLSEEQIRDLIDALDVCSEIEATPFMFQGNSYENKEVEKLEKKIRVLESFIEAKGHSISLSTNGVTEHLYERISPSHVASRDIHHRF